MNKIKLTANILNWIKNDFSIKNNFKILDILVSKNLRGTSNKYIIKNFNNSIWDFKPDICVIFEFENKCQIGLINRYTESIGLTNIGEMLCFSKISNPYFSFMISTKGHSREISPIILDRNIYPKLLNYSEDRFINLFCLKEEPLEINYETFIPVNMRSKYG